MYTHGLMCNQLYAMYMCICNVVSLLQWREYERQLMEEENRRILEFSQQQQAREEERMEQRRLQEEAMAAMQQQVGGELRKLSATPRAHKNGRLDPIKPCSPTVLETGRVLRNRSCA